MMEEPTCPATPPLSTCPATPPRSLSPKSSPQWADIKNNKTDTASPSGSRPSSPENCAICLGSLTNKSFTNSCLHQFCFVCLLEWSKVKAECPLCKVAFNSIIHNVRSQDDYDQYHVKQTPRPTSIWNSLPFRYRTTVTYHEFSNWVAHRTYPQISSSVSIHEAIPSRQAPSRTFFRTRSTAGTSDFRRSVYRDDLWARLQPDVTGRYRECSPDFYRHNPAQLHRLIPFLNRELNVLLEDGSRCAFVMDRILDLLPVYGMSSSEFRTRVGSFIGAQHAAHFCHELRAYASSPYDIVGYDRSVQYFPSAASNFQDEVNDIPSPSLSNNSVRDSDSDNDIQVIDLSGVQTPSAGTSHSRGVHTPVSQSGGRFSPQPGPSGLCTRSNTQSAAVSASSVVEVSSGSENEDEVEIVGYVKPRHERTPEIITLSSPEHPGEFNHVDNSSFHATEETHHDSSDDLICIHLGSTSSASHCLNVHYDNISSDDEILNLRMATSVVTDAEPMCRKRRLRKARSEVSSFDWTTSSSSDVCSDEEWEYRSKEKVTKKVVKRRTKTSKLCSKVRISKEEHSSESENAAQSSSSHHRTKKCKSQTHSKSSKSSSKFNGADARSRSSHGKSKKKKSEDSCSKSKRKFSESEDDENVTSRGKSKKQPTSSHHSSSKSRRPTNSENCHSSSHSSEFKSPKLRSIVMTRTTHEGRESWTVSHNLNSPESSQSGIQRPSRLQSVVAATSPCYSPRSDRMSDGSASSKTRHRKDNSSSSSSSSRKKQKSSKTSKSTRDCETDLSNCKRRNRSRSRENSCPKKWRQNIYTDSDSD